MKNYLFIIVALLISAVSFGQFRGNVFIVPDSVTNFGTSLTAGSLIYDTGSNRIWTLETFANPTDDLAAATKKLISESQTLENILSKGSTTADGQIITAEHGGGVLDLRWQNTDNYVSLNNGSAGVTIQDFAGTQFTCLTNDITGLSSTSQDLWFFGGYGYWWVKDLTDIGNPINGGFNIYNNRISDAIVTNGSTNSFPTSASVSQAIIKAGVINSMATAGKYITVKTDETHYSYNFGFNYGHSLFETIITAVPPTVDRQIFFPDLSGTVALTSQLLENTDITLAGNRTINGGGNELNLTNLTVFSVNATTDVTISSLNNIQITPQTTGTVNIAAGTIEPTAKLQINSTTQGFLPPRLTTGERNTIINPAAGLIVYNITTNRAQIYNGNIWVQL